MGSLPPELQLKIAQKCDFATVSTLSKLNKHWEELISSSWSSLEKLNLRDIELHYGHTDDEDDCLHIKCEIRLKNDRKRTLRAKFDNVTGDFTASRLHEVGWSIDDVDPEAACEKIEYKLRRRGSSIQMKAVDALLAEFLAPIFRKSTIHFMRLKFQKSFTLQAVIGLLEEYRPLIYELDIWLGSCAEKDYSHDPLELANTARLVELAKPKYLRFFDVDGVPDEVLTQHFLQKIAKQEFSKVRFSNVFLWHKPGAADGDQSGDPVTVNAPIPRSPHFQWRPFPDSAKWGQPAMSMLVDLVEEWCHETRDIDHYEFQHEYECLGKEADRFEQELRDRNLPILIEVVGRRENFRIKKVASRGDYQDELVVTFIPVDDDGMEVFYFLGSIEIDSAKKRSEADLDFEKLHECRHCGDNDDSPYSKYLPFA